MEKKDTAKKPDKESLEPIRFARWYAEVSDLLDQSKKLGEESRQLKKNSTSLISLIKDLKMKSIKAYSHRPLK